MESSGDWSKNTIVYKPASSYIEAMHFSQQRHARHELCYKLSAPDHSCSNRWNAQRAVLGSAHRSRYGKAGLAFEDSHFRPIAVCSSELHASLAGAREGIIELDPGRDVHAKQLLEQQLRSIWNGHPHHIATGLTSLAPFMLTHEPALLANIDFVRIAAQHEPFDQELRRAIGDETVTLHLSETQTASSGSSLCRLSRQDRSRSCGTRMHLILHHVLQLLVVDWTKENVSWQRLAGDATGDIILSGVGVASLDEQIAHIFDSAPAERSAVLLRTGKHTSLATDELNHLAHRHS